MRNVLAHYIRKDILQLNEAQLIMNEAASMMKNQEYEVTSNHVLELAANSTCSAYDCEFVALANDLNVKLVTIDKKILSEFPDTAVSLEEYASIGR